MSEETQVAPQEPVIQAAASDGTNPPESAPEAKVEETTKQDDNLPKLDDDEKAEKAHQRKFDKRIAQLNRKIGEERARADFLQQQIEAAKPKPQVSQSGLKLADFDYDEDRFAKAVAEEAEQRAIKRHGEELQAKTRKQAEEQLVKSWESKTSKAEDKFDDFDEVVGELKPVNPINIAIMQAENGDEIAYYLGKNLSEAKRIAALDPVSAVREIGRLEAKLLAEPPKIKEPSKAPAPIVPLNGKAASVSDIPSDDDDTATWIRKERARVNKARA